MPTKIATAIANPNIALIKYWGNRDDRLRLPANGSISMNLAGLTTRTQVSYDPTLSADQLVLNGKPVGAASLARVSLILERVRSMAGLKLFAQVESANNFPMGAGIASSASAFAALSLAATAAAGLKLSERDLSRLARIGSGSACRSIPGGFVEWLPGAGDADSVAVSIAPPEHWALADCVAIVSQEHKQVGSAEGHALAATSPLQAARIADAPTRLAICREAILAQDFESLAGVVELDSNLMHAVMMTSTPPLIYSQPATLAVMHSVRDMRRDGLAVCYTIDAGPNVHVLCLRQHVTQVVARLSQIPGVLRVVVAHPGGPARLVS